MSSVFLWFGLASIFIEGQYQRKMYRAVKGSHERYVLATKRRIFSWAAIIGYGLGGFLLLAFGESPISYFFGILDVLLAAYQFHNERKIDEDDWFSGRGKKIMSGAKNYLKSLSPKSLASPAGV